MTTKLVLSLFGVWTLLMIGSCSGVYYVLKYAPWHHQRAEAFGICAFLVGSIGYAAIMAAWGVACNRRGKAQRAQEEEEEEERRRKPRLKSEV